MKSLVCLLLVALFATPVSAEPRKDFDWDTFSLIAIQERGRIKPLDTMAVESVQFITGKRSWGGYNATELVLAWMVEYEQGWDDKEFIRIDYGPLKKATELADKKYFSPNELRQNSKLGALVRTAARKEQKQEKLNETEKKAVRIQNKLSLAQAIVEGRVMTILPNPQGENEAWFPISALANPERGLPYSQEQISGLSESFGYVVKAYLDREASAWKTATEKFATFLSEELGESSYPAANVLEREQHYNHLRPFRAAWILYTLAFIFLVAYSVTRNKAIGLVGGLATISGFFIHAYGMTLRCIIANRPPVTNMYESIIWVSLGTLFFAGLVWFKYRKPVILSAAVVFSAISLVLGDNLPVLFDPGIHPLEPVLRSNFWLTIHVLTITLSYAAFALSLCLGNVVMGYYVFATKQVEKIQYLNLYMYRAMQIGVLLLAAGTILGGVWADYSWGRFWGWDPKEVWALIALLLYIAVLHGRFAGWLKGFGFAAAAIVSFLGVLMAWYGVNFVLGVGLHSYGFGSGGLGYISAYIGVQLGFIAIAYVQYKKLLKDLGREPEIFPKEK